MSNALTTALGVLGLLIVGVTVFALLGVQNWGWHRALSMWVSGLVFSIMVAIHVWRTER
jgi:hypothetical protein